MQHVMQSGMLADVEHCFHVLHDLEQVWGDVTSVDLWWDDFKGVFVTKEARRTRRALYGKHSIRWIRDLRRRVRMMRRGERSMRWQGQFPAPVLLPADAVVIPLDHHDGVVVASASQRRVLKVVTGERGVRHLKNEVTAWSLIESAGIEKYVPALIDYGKISGRWHWAITELAPNTKPFLNRFRRYVWRRWLRQHILPVMERFYEASGLEILDADDLLQIEYDRLNEYDAPGPLWEVARLAEKTRPPRGTKKVARAMIHGDLHPMHVHRDGKDWWLLDWGLLKRQEVYMDVLDKHYLRPSAFPSHQQTFWAWLRGSLDLEQLPYNMRADLRLFLHWQASWLDVNVDASNLRYQILVFILRDMHDRARESGFAEALKQEGSVGGLTKHSDYEIMRAAKRLRHLGIS